MILYLVVIPVLQLLIERKRREEERGERHGGVGVGDAVEIQLEGRNENLEAANVDEEGEWWW